jgi:dinuclear metal center YbgI/SA1388 family protein
VGLLLGEETREVGRLMTCLTLTPETVAEALESGAQMVVSHHPIFFRPVKRLTSATAEGQMLLALARAAVAVYSPHSAFDNTTGGINDRIARRLGLIQISPLRGSATAGQYKVVVFAPEVDVGRVADAMFGAGAGIIGQYSQCSFRMAGTGTFFGSEATHPTVGQKGRREEVAEWRLEMICPAARINEVITALRAAHSYEEPAFDIYPLHPSLSGTGEGRLGRLSGPMPLGRFADLVKTVLGVAGVQVAGRLDQPIERVAIACGAAGEFLADTTRSRADVFLTGELRFHECLAAQAQGLAVVLPGHFASERLGVEGLAELLQNEFPGLTVWASRRERDPLAWV